MAKLIVRGKDRAEAISRMSRALEMFVVEGIYTSIPLHRRIMRDPRFPRRQHRYQVHGAVPGREAVGLADDTRREE